MSQMFYDSAMQSLYIVISQMFDDSVTQILYIVMLQMFDLSEKQFLYISVNIWRQCNAITILC